MLDREPLSDGHTRLTFTLPAQDPPGEVSVVGDFNNWVAGQHPFRLSPDGTRKVAVIVGPGTHYFRYLASDNQWSDDPDADSVTEHGSIINCHGAGIGQTSVVELPAQLPGEAELNSLATH